MEKTDLCLLLKAVPLRQKWYFIFMHSISINFCEKCFLKFISIKLEYLIPWSKPYWHANRVGSLCSEQIFQVDNINLNNPAA